MKKYLVTIVLVVGYHWDESEGSYDLDSPKLQQVDFEMEANTESEAISLAKDKETSKHSVWESYAFEM